MWPFDVTSCNAVGVHRRYGGSHCLCLQGETTDKQVGERQACVDETGFEHGPCSQSGTVREQLQWQLVGMRSLWGVSGGRRGL